MRKKLVTPITIILGLALLSESVISPAYAADTTWKSPWERKLDVNLQTLINDGYEIVGTNLVYGFGREEIIFLKKSKSLYRCNTVQIGNSVFHDCYILISPERNE